MKRQIRRGVFETNSSSTHSIAIPNKVEQYKSHADFFFNDFGWVFEEVDALDYLHTAIYVRYEKDEAMNKIEQLKSILDKHGVTYYFAEPSFDKYGFASGYIDHSYDVQELIDALFNDEDLLMRYITAARVFTGNDNCTSDKWALVHRDSPIIEDYNWKTKETTVTDNPYYIGDGYQWFYKGN